MIKVLRSVKPITRDKDKFRNCKNKNIDNIFLELTYFFIPKDYKRQCSSEGKVPKLLVF